MRFGSVPVADAIGAIAAHGLKAGDVVLKKGARIDERTVAALLAAGVAEVVVARLERDDVPEDEAARRLAERATGHGLRIASPFTGRANIFAETAGLVTVSPLHIDAVNAVDEAITIATLPAFAPVRAGAMVGTVKIIPYAVAGTLLDRALRAMGDSPVLGIAPFRAKKIGVVSTLLPGLKPSVVRKTLHVLADRLAPAGATIAAERQVAHARDPLAAELRGMAAGESEILIVFGASAITDRRDVIPTAIEAAGGQVEHLGMPVDPGNLLLIGTLAGKPVIGAPGCARSPKENGFDWVLQRLLADLSIGREAITRMGVGGLLMEIATRPQPRAGDAHDSAA